MNEEEKEAIDIVTKAKFVNGNLIKCDVVDYAWAVGKLIQGVNKRDKIIELMAEEILILDIKRAGNTYDHARIWETEKGIKQYFTKKAEEEDVKD